MVPVGRVLNPTLFDIIACAASDLLILEEVLRNHFLAQCIFSLSWEDLSLLNKVNISSWEERLCIFLIFLDVSLREIVIHHEEVELVLGWFNPLMAPVVAVLVLAEELVRLPEAL